MYLWNQEENEKSHNEMFTNLFFNKQFITSVQYNAQSGNKPLCCNDCVIPFLLSYLSWPHFFLELNVFGVHTLKQLGVAFD